jgi:hypothetical protein
VRFLAEHQLPGWISALVEAVRVRLTRAGKVYGGLRHHLDMAARCSGQWVIYIYPAPVLVENGTRRTGLLPRFTVDALQLTAAFDSVTACDFVANDGTQRDIQGDYLRVHGVYYGQTVTLCVCAEPPDNESPAFVFREDGTVDAYDPFDPTMIPTDVDDDEDDDWDEDDWDDEDDELEDEEDWLADEAADDDSYFTLRSDDEPEDDSASADHHVPRFRLNDELDWD